jgi:hypothetical protein
VDDVNKLGVPSAQPLLRSPLPRHFKHRRRYIQSSDPPHLPPTLLLDALTREPRHVPPQRMPNQVYVIQELLVVFDQLEDEIGDDVSDVFGAARRVHVDLLRVLRPVDSDDIVIAFLVVGSRQVLVDIVGTRSLPAVDHQLGGLPCVDGRRVLGVDLERGVGGVQDEGDVAVRHVVEVEVVGDVLDFVGGYVEEPREEGVDGWQGLASAWNGSFSWKKRRERLTIAEDREHEEQELQEGCAHVGLIARTVLVSNWSDHLQMYVHVLKVAPSRLRSMSWQSKVPQESELSQQLPPDDNLRGELLSSKRSNNCAVVSNFSFSILPLSSAI